MHVKPNPPDVLVGTDMGDGDWTVRRHGAWSLPTTGLDPSDARVRRGRTSSSETPRSILHALARLLQHRWTLDVRFPTDPAVLEEAALSHSWTELVAPARPPASSLRPPGRNHSDGHRQGAFRSRLKHPSTVEADLAVSQLDEAGYPPAP